MSIKVEAKTLARLNIENCSYIKEQCLDCIAECEFEGTPTFRGRWVSEVDYKEQARICHPEIYWEQEARIEGLVVENKKLQNEKAVMGKCIYENDAENMRLEILVKSSFVEKEYYRSKVKALSAIQQHYRKLVIPNGLVEESFKRLNAWALELGVLLQPKELDQKTEKEV